MPEPLNAHVPVTAVASANQASLRFGDARVTLKDIVRLDCDKSVPGMPSRHGRSTLSTCDYWNARHICTTADNKVRVSVVTRVAPPDVCRVSRWASSSVRETRLAGTVPGTALRFPGVKETGGNEQVDAGRDTVLPSNYAAGGAPLGASSTTAWTSR